MMRTLEIVVTLPNTVNSYSFNLQNTRDGWACSEGIIPIVVVGNEFGHRGLNLGILLG